MNRGNGPLRRCLENSSHNSASHDGAEDDGSETAIDAQERYSIHFR